MGPGKLPKNFNPDDFMKQFAGKILETSSRRQLDDVYREMVEQIGELNAREACEALGEKAKADCEMAVAEIGDAIETAPLIERNERKVLDNIVGLIQ